MLSRAPSETSHGVAERISETMAELALSLERPGDPTETLHALTRAACDTVPGVDFASITVIQASGELETVAPSDPIVRQADQLQYELREGPCFDAAAEERVFVCENLAADARWPSFGPKAAALGFGALMGIDLDRPGEQRAALNLYASQTWPFVDAHDTAMLFASHAQLLLGYVSTVQHLTSALDSRGDIGRAVGIVMERYGLDPQRAFEFLVRVSQTTNTRLRDVADSLVSDTVAKQP